MLLFIVFSLINYLLGSIPFALVIGKAFYHTDVRQFGSGNLGATNTGRVLGKLPAYLVAFLDGCKGLIAYLIEAAINPQAALFASIFVVVGHCWPLFAGFKGGKGVATTCGIIVAISLGSWKMLLLCAVIPGICWYLISHFTEYVSLASLFSLLLSAVLSTFATDNIYITLVFTLLLILVTYRHKENIMRLINGTESKKNY